LYPEIRTAAPLETSDDREHNVFEIVAHLAVPKLWTPAEGTHPYRASFAALSLYSILETPEEGRIAPFEVAYPLRYNYTIRLGLPFDLPVTPQQHEEVESAALRLRFTSSGGGREAVYAYDLATKADHARGADLAAHATALRRARVLLERAVTYRSPELEGRNWWAIAGGVLLLPLLAWGAIRWSRFQPRSAPREFDPRFDPNLAKMVAVQSRTAACRLSVSTGHSAPVVSRSAPPEVRM
jgi:hypothetical protein